MVEMYRARAQNYRNTWDPARRFFCPRGKGGEFHCPLCTDCIIDGGDKKGGYVEGDAQQWRWFVPHDVPGLVQARGLAPSSARPVS